MISLKGKDFLTLLDFTPAEIQGLLDMAAELKALKKQGTPHRLCEGKKVALIFEKTSTRTRCAFESAAADLGIYTTYLDSNGSQIGKKESIEDSARIIASMYDGIEYRGFGHEIVETLAEYSKVPVWNGLTNEFHPTQAMADLLTMIEYLGSLKGRKLVFMGDARYNMCNSVMIGCAKMGVNFVACSPKEYQPAAAIVEKAQEAANQSGATISFEEDPKKAVVNADVIYTDVWVSMGEPDEVWAKRIHDLLPYRVTQELMDIAGPQCYFMHCLPSFHDRNTTIGEKIYQQYGIDCMEVTDEVFEGPRSIVFDEAENRMHTAKAIMAATL